MRFRSPHRSGTTTVESAFVLPIFFLFVIGTIIAGLGVFRFQEVASLAREATRYASVRGNTYSQVTGQKAATAKDVYQFAILPNAKGMDLSKLTYSVTWSPDNRQGATVTVRITYRWIPEAFLGGRDLTSTSTDIVSF